MEWVEVRGETVAEAEELALDQLGVAREDAEFEVVQAPESRWLGLKRVEARVRARVRPSAPPPKTDRNRRRRGAGSGDEGGEGAQRGAPSRGRGRGGAKERAGNRDGGGARGNGDDRAPAPSAGGERARPPRAAKVSTEGSGGQDGGERPVATASAASAASASKEKAVTEESTGVMPVKEQQDVLTEFLQGLVGAFGMEATALSTLDDDTVVGSVDGADVGLLIGPRGGTLRAVQEIARTTMQRQADGRDTNRLVIDVGGYRERRRSALEAFTRSQAEKVIATGESLAFEPMGSADRKIVHDTAAEIDGVTSTSAGEDPYRHVVLNPAD